MYRFVLVLFSFAIAAAQKACPTTVCPVGAVCLELGEGKSRCTAPRSTVKIGNCTKGHEEWKECASCEPTCEKRKASCAKKCQPGRCVCRPGFFRNNEGRCVTDSDCDLGIKRVRRANAAPRSQKDCVPNATFRECSSLCPPKCGEYTIKMPCPHSCGPPKCECNAGFYTNRVGDCVNRFDCEVEAAISITCANIDCVSGFICKMTNGAPKCYPGKNVTCKGFDCDVGHHCAIVQRVPRCVRTGQITCANVRCAGRCKDTPSGPMCGSRPQILPKPDPSLSG